MEDTTNGRYIHPTWGRSMEDITNMNGRYNPQTFYVQMQKTENGGHNQHESIVDNQEFRDGI